MIKLINIKLYNNDNIEQEYNDIKAIYKDNTYSFLLDNIKTTISNNILSRETDEYRFELNIKDKKAVYNLKTNNMIFDIDVEKIMYKEEKNIIILEYKISSEEGLLKIVLELKGDINE